LKKPGLSLASETPCISNDELVMIKTRLVGCT